MNVGDQLLIYIINTDSKKDLSDKVNSALQLGVAERNSKGLNCSVIERR